MRLTFTKLSLAALTAGAVLAGFTESAKAGDLVGVASCDSFLKTYETCVAAKLPADQRSSVAATIEQTKANWKTVAASAEGKTQLDTTCKETTAKMKAEVAALNCPW